MVAGNNGIILQENSGLGAVGNLCVARMSLLFLMHCVYVFASIYYVSFSVLNWSQRLG